MRPKAEHLTFLTAEFGQPFTAGFGNWFSEQCNLARIPKNLRAHGLRKAGATRFAERDCSDHEIIAWGGWTTLKEVQRYTRTANRIAIERIMPDKPQQNGRHERVHLTLKKEATQPPGQNSLQQQSRFDAFVHEFNAERPHEALAMKCPAELYNASARHYDGHPSSSIRSTTAILVTACGRICLRHKEINISTLLAGQSLGIKEVDEGIWLASFMRYDLGCFDLE